MTDQRRSVTVSGTVQGVGFPFFYIYAMYRNRAAVRRVETAQKFDQCRFASAVFANQGETFAGFYMQINAR